MSDQMSKYKPTRIARSVGTGLMGGAFLTALLGDNEIYAQVMAITGGATYIGSYVAECASYLKGYFNEQLDAQKQNPSKLEEKLRD